MELRDYQKRVLMPWFFYGHVTGARLHYTVTNRITGETLCTYRQIKKARQTVRELNAGGRRLMQGCRLPSKSSAIKQLRSITGAKQ